jgi:predicted  nucleic acid-binding Zn-ribbon protein
VPSGAHDPEDPLKAAHAQRTRQVYEARGALAEAVSTLTSELVQRRHEVASLRDEQRAGREYAQSLQEEASKQSEHAAVLEAELKRMHEEAVRLTAQLRAANERLGAKLIRRLLAVCRSAAQSRRRRR